MSDQEFNEFLEDARLEEEGFLDDLERAER